MKFSIAILHYRSSAVAAPSMNYRQLEEAINKWTLELEEQEKIFLQQATQVNAWDRLLIDNGEKVMHQSMWKALGRWLRWVGGDTCIG